MFKDMPDNWSHLEVKIISKGWINLYWKEHILEKDIDALVGDNYSVIEFNCSGWTDRNKIHRDLKEKLNFPDYYGENFDALNDCLGDLYIPYNGQVIVFRHLDKVDSEAIHMLLDIFVDNARRHFVFGRKLLILVQVSNPKFIAEPVGAISLCWNDSEWLDSKRGI